MKKPFPILLILTYTIAISSCRYIQMADELNKLSQMPSKSVSETVLEEPPAETEEEEILEVESIPSTLETIDSQPPMDGPASVAAIEVEEVIDATPAALEEEVVLEVGTIEEPTPEPSPLKEAFTDPDRKRSATIGGTDVPDWFVYIFSALFLASLFTIAYIAKQRKEAHWYRSGRHDRD